MSQPYVGEIRILPYSRGAPRGWQMCDGSLLQISQYEVLFNLIGTTYGGDGQSTFGVPDLRGRVPIHQGTGRGLSSYALGQMAGTEEVTLTTQQMPAHNHLVIASSEAGSSSSPTANVLATVASEPFYVDMATGGTAYPLPPATLTAAGGNVPHDNTAPTLTLNYCIAWAGIYPSQN
ncbi:MAG: phage tail protein [Alphaproteobacteria bacterium]|nr:MAG: phage tail protein [Alphaproteobacteria bacterium]